MMLQFRMLKENLTIIQQYDKILSVETYSNGVGLQKDGANDKPIFLEGINSWFAYNVIANLKN